MEHDASRTLGVGTSACAGPPSLKRPCPADGAHQGGDGDCSDPASSSTRQRSSMPRPLSLLARCALNRGDSANPQHLLGGQNQQFQLPPGWNGIGGATARTAFQDPANNIVQLTGHPQYAQESASPAGDLVQNLVQLQGINPLMTNQAMASMQPDMTLHKGQGQSQSHATAVLNPQCLAAMQPPSTAAGSDSSLLRPFGMSPQELLNYAVLVNILQKSIASGNAARANLAYNCSQAMVQSLQAGNNGVANSAAAASNSQAGSYLHHQGFNETLQLAKPEECNENTLINGIHAGLNNNANGGSSGDALSRTVENTPHPQQQVGCGESLELEIPNQSHETNPNDRVQAGHNNDSNGGLDEAAAADQSQLLGNYQPQQEGCRESQQLPKPNRFTGTTLTNTLQTECDNDADFEDGGDKTSLVENYPQQQGYNESLQIAKPNQTQENILNSTTVLHKSLHATGLCANSKIDTMENGRVNSIDGNTQSTFERNDIATGLEPSLARPNQQNNNALNNRGLHNLPFANGAHTHGRNVVNTNEANTQPTSRRNNTALALPGNVLQVQQKMPSRSVPLWTPEDEQRLSTQQCWLRKQIETFPASTRDVRTRGRNRLLDLGQVGIQCIHCKNLPQEGRGKGSSYFPASIKSIYQSAQNMLTFHFKEDTCPLTPRRLLQQMRDAGETSAICPRMAPKAGKSRTGGGKPYWEATATTVTGLVDTTVGIRYSNDVQNYQPLESIALETTESELHQNNTESTFQAEGSILTSIDDRGKVTDFCFILMSQFGPYCTQVSAPSSDMMKEDEWDSDIENEETLPSIGIVCQFCRGVSHDGKQSKGIFLSSKADTMSRNKNLARMYNHLLVCAPEDLKTKLMQAKNIHLPQSDRLKKGWKKHFFENVCNRLHESLLDEDDD